MVDEPPTCAICGVLITEDRGGEQVLDRSEGKVVRVHPACRGKQPTGSPETQASPPDLPRDEMLRALQNDVNSWPDRVRDAGVTNAGGAAYVPLPRNNEILRTPDDPEATCAYMIRTWENPEAETGSEGWFRIISQAGPTLTWEWLIADPTREYAPLFPPELRQRVTRALQADAGTSEWTKRQQASAADRQAQQDRVQQIREEIRTGKRQRLSLPELDRNLDPRGRHR